MLSAQIRSWIELEVGLKA